METPTPPSPSPEEPRGRPFPFPWLVIVPALVLVVVFLALTPPDLLAAAGSWFLAKPAMIGYAVCHQIRSHSFIICGHQLPLCARCTGTFAGALIGFFGQIIVLRRRRTVDFPPPLIIAVLVGFMLAWAVDGTNSYVGSILGGPRLYEPRHELRVLTGALNGLTMSALVYPAFSATVWRRAVPERAIRNLRDLGVLVLLELGMVGLVLFAAEPFAPLKLAVDAVRQITEPSLLDAGSVFLGLGAGLQCLLLYPLAWFSTLGVLALLTSVNTMLVLIFTQRENRVDSWRDARIPLLAGFAVGLLQIGVITLVRYTVTGSFAGLASFL